MEWMCRVRGLDSCVASSRLYHRSSDGVRRYILVGLTADLAAAVFADVGAPRRGGAAAEAGGGGRRARGTARQLHAVEWQCRQRYRWRIKVGAGVAERVMLVRPAAGGARTGLGQSQDGVEDTIGGCYHGMSRAPSGCRKRCGVPDRHALARAEAMSREWGVTLAGGGGAEAGECSRTSA